MLSLTGVLPDVPSERAPIVLIHGAANAAPVWTFWQRELALAGWPSYALDLRGHEQGTARDLSQTRMADYAADVRVLIEQFGRAPIVMGWSMGGLVALMAATTGRTLACVGLAPSTPERAVDASVTLCTGEFGAEEYGLVSVDPRDQPQMPDLDLDERSVALSSLRRESRLAKDERKAGVVIETLTCPLLIVTGSQDRQWPRSRYDGLWLQADYLDAPGASHWGLVLNRRVLAALVPAVIAWLSRVG